MASKTEIANRTLSKLGEGRVSNIETDNTKAAKVIRYMYDSVRDAMLSAYPWNFAVTRKQLAKDATAPVWGYNNQYTLPSNFLSLLEIKGNPDYRMESDETSGGLRIVTNAGSPLYIRYIRRVINEGEFHPLFNEAFSCRLALEGCEEITQSNTKKQILFEEMQLRIKEAYAVDAIQDLPVELPASEWLLSRESTDYMDDIDYNA